MNKFTFLSLAALALACSAAHSQQLRNGYITTPNGQLLHKYVNQWEPGKQIATTYDADGNSAEWEDEEFFIGRVALKPCFTNSATQIDKTKLESENKRLLLWMPLNNPLPNARFDSEVFSTWSYVTHFSNRNSPFGWVPGAMADVAHKNGVLVSGTATIPYGDITSGWTGCLDGIGNFNSDEGVEKLGRFLRYHGVDGLAYDSQFSNGKNLMANIQGLHGKLTKWMKQYQPAFENIWYSRTNDDGAVTNYDRLSSDFYETFGYSTEPRSALVLGNYWNIYSSLNQTASGIEATGRDPRDLYTQTTYLSGYIGNTPDWITHLSLPYSICILHNFNANSFWSYRNYDSGRDVKHIFNDKTRQTNYQLLLEQWFTNGKRNPLYKLTPCNDMIPSINFMGMSRYMEARSSLGWDLTKEPFVTFFNIGNGTFYNWKGATSLSREWYNIGVQDYMPTWRFWTSGEYLGSEPSDNIRANITWEDAYMGGSSLMITADNNTSDYLHLFKTNFNIKNNTTLTIRYKLLKGSGDLELVWSNVGDEATQAQGNYGKLFDSDGNTYSSTDADGSLQLRQWQVKTIKMSSRNNLAGNTMAALGLKISNARDLELLIGEISLTYSSYATPNPPVITRAKVLANNYHGIDGKIFYKMSNTNIPGNPVYNLDVNTSLFRLWSRTDADPEPKFMGTTTSWAGMIFAAPAANASSIQFGVSAVSLDFGNESEIAWSEMMPLGDYSASDEIEVSDTPVYINEPISVKFVDPKAPAASWQIKDDYGVTVASADNASGINIPDGLDRPGQYDVVVNGMNHTAAIVVTPRGSGRKPVIESLSVDGFEPEENRIDIQSGNELTLRYSAREADGYTSKGVVLDHKPFGVRVSDLGIDSYESFSVAFWLKVDEYDGNNPCSLMLIENRNGSWPRNCYGYFWSRTTNGSFRNDGLDGGFAKRMDGATYGNRLYCDYNGNLGLKKWNHLVYVFEYENGKYLRTRFYLNGQLLTIRSWANMSSDDRKTLIGSSGWTNLADTPDYQSIASAYGSDVAETGPCADQFPIAPNDWIVVGGVGPNGMSALYGAIDDFQVWGKAMTQEDVILSKNGLGALDNLPDDVIAFWDLESEPDSDFGFVSKGRKEVKSYLFDYIHRNIEGKYELQTPIHPIVSAGSPLVAGDANIVTTLPQWNTTLGSITNPIGSDTEGHATLLTGTNVKNGDYTVSLTLSNTLGADTKSYPVFTISSTDAITSAPGSNSSGVEAYTVTDGLLLHFANAGNYTVEVYGTNGLLMAQKSASITAGQNIFVSIDAQGIYLIKVSESGSLTRTLKIKK